MERHHAAERHLYPELIDVFKQIREEHPGVIIGAVTDGKANPLFMTFTLAPYFDFCMSWEDDQGNRQKFFKELGNVQGNVELKWIYDAAKEKYYELAKAQYVMQNDDPDSKIDAKDKVWIHVGDDLAYDVGGAALSGAKTIYVELADQYGQTARHRFDQNQPQPSWSMMTQTELEKRKAMNEAAKEFVNAKINFLTRLPESVNEILEQE
jgi:FMN phosphatase YigB (HAD superfamily)